MSESEHNSVSGVQTCYDVTVQNISHYATGTTILVRGFKMVIIEKKNNGPKVTFINSLVYLYLKVLFFIIYLQ